MGFVDYDFNDSETLTRSVNFSANSDEIGLDIQTHLYNSYGTYYPKVILRNNISLVEINITVEVEQCVTDFKIEFEEKRYLREHKASSKFEN